MEFASADPSVIKSIRQRYLLNEWLRLAGKRPPMPLQRDFQLDRVDEETVDMMGYDVVGEADGARFLITHQGARLATTYGNERVDPAERRRFLDEAIGPERYANVVAQAQSGSAEGFARGLQKAGYATDPDYASKLARVINTTVRVQRAMA